MGHFFSSFFVLLLLVALACRAGLASMLCFVASPWRYESLLPTAAKVTKSAVRLLLSPAGCCAIFKSISSRGRAESHVPVRCAHAPSMAL